ncbi:hypothetical protein ATCV1_z730L [Acanthocystis turfacea chlorella virus 1]|uniref:Uncharacterized protein z730L n=1 Tax=Chlorovirus heliozoae TaxID=322019 RepID=A7K9Z0_9PHYC|nr:hypothetical protein ATCV1_z730L [Acanthocystis turfacea chlorella virus 1]ABT16864.1 hypothetical protein ATCV1_z730L [Acanthocystis turfacea chlorella virus 1]
MCGHGNAHDLRNLHTQCSVRSVQDDCSRCVRGNGSQQGRRFGKHIPKCRNGNKIRESVWNGHRRRARWYQVFPPIAWGR